VKRGFTLGENLAYEARGSAGKVGLIPTLLQELKAANVDAVVTTSYPAAVAAKASGVATVIASGSGDPVATEARRKPGAAGRHHNGYFG
jgi:putative ABC transport system substrate-binding protein